MADNTALTNTQIPCISVIIPVFNVEKYLAQALDSVLCQTLRNIEMICIDDGSTDSTPQILAEYATRDSRIHVITQENRGVGAARNVGIRAAKGEFVAFLDPDDFLPDGRTYAELYSAAKENHVKVCGGSVHTFNILKNKISPPCRSGYIADHAFVKDGILSFSEWQYDYGFYRYIFDREMLVEDEIFYPEYIRFQDPPFCARALEAAGKFCALQRPTYIYRWGHNQHDFTDPRRIFDLLCGIRDQLEFSRERGYAKLHWLQIHRLFEEFKPRICAVINSFPELVVSYGSQPLPDSATPIAKKIFHILCDIDGLVDIALARKYKPDTSYFSVYGDIFEPRIKVSVVVPVYNVEEYLAECLDSIVNQTLKEIEIVCVDDGSTDSSPKILQEYAKRDSRIKIVRKENNGLGAARNTGIENSKGKYIYFVDSDDILRLYALQEMFEEAGNLNLDVLFFGAEPFFETVELEKKHKGYKEFYIRRGNYPSVMAGKDLSVLMQKNRADFMSAYCFISRAKFLEDNNIRFPEKCLYEDHLFFFLLLRFAKRAFVVHDSYYLRRVREGSIMTRERDIGNFDSYFRVVNDIEKVRKKEVGTEFAKVLYGHCLRIVPILYGIYKELSVEEKVVARNELLEKRFNDSELVIQLRKKIEELDLPKKIQESQMQCARGESSFRNSNLRMRGGASPSSDSPKGNSRAQGSGPILKGRNTADTLLKQDKDGVFKRVLVRVVALLIFSKKNRIAFRAKHLNLRPKDGIDINKLSPSELAILRERGRSKSVFWRVFDAVVPATRGKMVHIERHLRENLEVQTRNLCRMLGEQMQGFIAELRGLRCAQDVEIRKSRDALNAEVRKLRDETNKKLDEVKRQIVQEHSNRIGWIRERISLRVLAASQAQKELVENAQAEMVQEMDAIRQDVAVLKQFVAQSATEGKEYTANVLLPEFAKVAQNLQDISSSVATLKQSAEQASAGGDTVKRLLDDIIHATAFMKSALSELEWGQVFNNAIANSDWLANKSFFPGRWAVGYPFLYVLYRVLTDAKPRCILELGLGQTTRMISQYAAGNPKIVHTVVEHDLLWKENFSKSFDLPKSTEVKMLELAKVAYGDAPEVVVYKDFAKTFSGKKFDFICIDGPFGGMAKKYARVDILPLLPECLNSSFVIMLDDYNRAGEKATAAEIRRILKEANIEFFEKIYYGEKQFWIATSSDLKFLCSC
ncbi:MAG: glycosyltransferase [Opitutae bacterium]|nr:glycosyltransferase [Opitutae bacterium]